MGLWLCLNQSLFLLHEKSKMYRDNIERWIFMTIFAKETYLM